VKTLVLKDAILSKYDSFDFVWNRFANTQGRADSNLELDRRMEHRIRQAKGFLNRLGANFSPGIAQAYTRSLDVLTDLADDVDEALDCRVPTSRHSDPDRHPDVLKLAVYLEIDGVFEYQQGRPNLRESRVKSLFAVDTPKLKKWVLRVLKVLESGTTWLTEHEEEMLQVELAYVDIDFDLDVNVEEQFDEPMEEEEFYEPMEEEEFYEPTEEENIEPEEPYLFDTIIPGTLAAVDFGFEVLETESYLQGHEMSLEIAEVSMENEEVFEEEEGVLDLDRILLLQSASRRTPTPRRTSTPRRTAALQQTPTPLRTAALPLALGPVVTDSPSISSTRPVSPQVQAGARVGSKRRKFLE
jgi:hypothetical protein